MYLLYPMCICIYIHTYMSLHRMLKMMYFLAISVRLVRRKEEGGKKKEEKGLQNANIPESPSNANKIRMFPMICSDAVTFSSKPLTGFCCCHKGD